MAQWVAELYKSGVGATERAVAAASGAVYAIVSQGSPLLPTVVKITDAGVISWQKELTLPSSADASSCVIAVNGSNVAVGFNTSSPSTDCFVALLAGADGSITWQQQLPFRLDNFSTVYLPQCLAVNGGGDVFVAGRSSSTDHRLVKLAAADGTVSWAKNPLDTGSAGTTTLVQQLALMSNGDVVSSFSNASNTPAVLVFDGSAGTLEWARNVSFPSSTTRSLCAVDTSNNVYVTGMTGASGTLDIVKFSSTGTETWKKKITLSPSGDSIAATGGMAADGTYAYLGTYIASGSYQRMVAAAIALDGSAASGVAYTMPATAFTSGTESLSAASSDLYAVAFNTVSTFQRAVIGKSEPPDFGPLGFTGSYARASVSYTVADSSATTSTFTPTLASDPTVTPSSGGLSSATGAMTLALYEPVPPLIRFAYSLAPVARFGTPRWANAYPATSVAPGAQFGTPALDYDLEPVATSIAPSVRFGDAYAFQYLPDPGKHFAMAVLPATRFGTPAAAATRAGAASSLAPTAVFGLATARLRQTASGWTSTALGTPKVGAIGTATGFSSTAFGTPKVAGIHATSGFSSTVFGQPTLRLAKRTAQASGFTSTTFGTPTASQRHLATSLLARARFGTPHTVRPC